jgi:putative heme-binding domain-containing protein
MTFDPAGRIIIGLDDRGLARLQLNEQNDAATFHPLENTDSLKHVRGVLFAHDSLYVSATNSQAIYRLQDFDGDGQFESQKVIQELPYTSRYGHGTNQMTLGPDDMVYVVVGNDVVFPPSLAANSPYRNHQNDWLLPSSHDAGHDDRVGYIAKIDPEGKSWTIVAGGFRNQVDVAFNQHGEMFTWDADMEWDIGLPWYRPTRLNHVVSGGEYGWRWGTGKWPNWYPDSLPATLDTGLGSPTGLVFESRSNWPQEYRDALFMADWQLGRILQVKLTAQGATYDAESAIFLEGGPLNVCDMEFGPDGALYFITGGRGSQSGLYRVTWTGSPQASPIATTEDLAKQQADSLAAEKNRRLRHQLETYHQQIAADRIDFIWQNLGNEDLWIRHAARIALENQPIASWRDTATAAPDSIAKQTALLAIARIGGKEDQSAIFDHMGDSDWASLQSQNRLLPLRTLQVSIARHGLPDEAIQQRLLVHLDPLFPDRDFSTNWLLQELLVKLQSSSVLASSIDLIEQADTQEEQFQYAKTLTHISAGWDLDHAKRVIQWLEKSRRYTGGKLVETNWRNLKNDFQVILSSSLQDELTSDWERLSQPLPETMESPQPLRPIVRKWTIEELVDDVNALRPEQTTKQQGERALAAANCLTCHRIGQRGSFIGPDLTHVGKRLDGRALLESIIDPSRQVDPKYLNTNYLMSDGRLVSGRTVGVSKNQLTIEVDSTTGGTVAIDRVDIEASVPGTRSPMPDGLVDTLTRDEILSLIALLRG